MNSVCLRVMKQVLFSALVSPVILKGQKRTNGFEWSIQIVKVKEHALKNEFTIRFPVLNKRHCMLNDILNKNHNCIIVMPSFLENKALTNTK